MPADAAGYSLDLPKDFTFPPGVDGWSFDTNDPAATATLAMARRFAWDNGLDQNAFGRMLALHATNEIANAAQIKEAMRARLALLGPSAPARVDAVKTWVHALVGDAAPPPTPRCGPFAG